MGYNVVRKRLAAKKAVDPCELCSAPCRASACTQCDARVCDDCTWKQPNSECSLCGNYNIEIYTKKRAKCARLIFAHHGISPADHKKFMPEESIEIHTTNRRQTLDECIDEMLTALGDKLYDSRQGLTAYL